MTSSRDKDGQIRKQELLTIRELLEARSSEPTVLCGDFNINLRKGLDEHIFLGTGCERQGDERRLRWRGRGRDLVLRDAFDDLNGLEASSSTRTGTRLETIAAWRGRFAWRGVGSMEDHRTRKLQRT